MSLDPLPFVILGKRVIVEVDACSGCPFVGVESSYDECGHPHIEQAFPITQSGPPPLQCPLRNAPSVVRLAVREAA